MSDQWKKKIAAGVVIAIQVLSAVTVIATLPESWHKPIMAVVAILSAVLSALPKVQGEASAEKVVDMTPAENARVKP